MKTLAVRLNRRRLILHHPVRRLHLQRKATAVTHRQSNDSKLWRRKKEQNINYLSQLLRTLTISSKIIYRIKR